jgi:hypothetical protein
VAKEEVSSGIPASQNKAVRVEDKETRAVRVGRVAAAVRAEAKGAAATRAVIVVGARAAARTAEQFQGEPEYIRLAPFSPSLPPFSLDDAHNASVRGDFFDGGFRRD